MGNFKKSKEKLYKDVETDGTTDERTMKPTIKTSESEILKDTNREILIGESIEEIEKIEEDFSSKKRKMINKLMK